MSGQSTATYPTANLYPNTSISKQVNENNKILPEKVQQEALRYAWPENRRKRPRGNKMLNFPKNLGTLKLSEKSHRRLLINTSRKHKVATENNVTPTVSLLTPTMGARFTTLPLLWEWILNRTTLMTNSSGLL